MSAHKHGTSCEFPPSRGAFSRPGSPQPSGDAQWTLVQDEAVFSLDMTSRKVFFVFVILFFLTLRSVNCHIPVVGLVLPRWELTGWRFYKWDSVDRISKIFKLMHSKVDNVRERDSLSGIHTFWKQSSLLTPPPLLRSHFTQEHLGVETSN